MQTKTIKPDLFRTLRSAVAWLVIVLAFLLPYDPSGIRLTMDEPVTKETTVFHVTIHNCSHRTLGYGLDDFYIEKQTDRGWEQVKKAEHSVVEIAVLQETGDRDFLVDLQTVYGGPLEAGSYRFTFCCYVNHLLRGQKATASVTFTVQ